MFAKIIYSIWNNDFIFEVQYKKFEIKFYCFIRMLTRYISLESLENKNTELIPARTSDRTMKL